MHELLMRPMSILPCSRDLTFIRAEKCHLYDDNGKAYLDAFAANGNVLVGHAEPMIMDAYRNPPANASGLLFAELQKMIPGYLSIFQLFTSGVQALKTACEISRRFRNKPYIIAISEHIVHDSFLVLSASDGENFTPLFSIDTNFELVGHSMNHPPIIGQKALAAMGKSCKGACLCSLETFFAEISDQTAAIIIEPSTGVGGSIEPCRNFFSRLNDFCRANGIDLIANETQCGMGRTGSRFFGFQLLNIHPDIVCIGPSLANGYPIGVALYAAHFAEQAQPVKATAGSSCSAALATLRIIAQNDLLRRSEQLGSFLKSSLNTHLQEKRQIRHIRGLGLMLEIVLENEEQALGAHHRASSLGLITGTGSVRHNVLRLTPPLIFTGDMAETVCRILLDAIQK
jgi:4-aminobutyrate aminotransferase-like enzyme